MGLCPSRNNKSKFAEGKTYEPVQPQREPPTPGSQSQLRADAPAYVPAKEAKADWELFLDQKRQERATGKQAPFARRQDGTFTAEYRKLLESSKPKRNPTLQEVQAATGAVSADVVQAWKDCAPLKKKAPAAKPQLDPFTQAVRKARAMDLSPESKTQVLELLSAEKAAADDGAVCSVAHRMVPFGLSDRHYASGDEDNADSHQHRSRKSTPQRDYVTSKITPELEDTVTKVLHELRLLKQAEEQSRRYCVGLREAMRATKEPGALKAVLVAPDLEQNNGRGLDEKLQALLKTCKQNKIPVVFGLSRLRIGLAIKKSVTVSVLGILDTRGVQEPFDRMVKLA